MESNEMCDDSNKTNENENAVRFVGWVQCAVERSHCIGCVEIGLQLVQRISIISLRIWQLSQRQQHEPVSPSLLLLVFFVFAFVFV